MYQWSYREMQLTNRLLSLMAAEVEESLAVGKSGASVSETGAVVDEIYLEGGGSCAPGL